MARTQRYSELLSPEVHDRLMYSVDDRAERQADKRAQLPIEIGRAILGRRRPDTPVTPERYRIIPRLTLIALGKRLSTQPILRDHMTNKRHEPAPDEHLYERYVTAGNKHNKRPTPREEERLAKRQAMPRQTQNVADELHRFTWFQLQLARASKASLVRARVARDTDGLLSDTDSLYAASAIEDFGHCLAGNEALRGLSRGSELPREFRHIGVRGAEDPITLMSQDSLLFYLVKKEQDKRIEHWSNLLEAYESFGGDRRTQQDRLDEAWVDSYAHDVELAEVQ
jgi:hypothetical protein